MENPRVRVEVRGSCILDVGLWDLINMHIFERGYLIRGIENCELYLNGEKIEKPVCPKE